MKRKHFILALAAMLLSFAPPIFAQVAKVVGGTEYATLAEAVKAVPAGGTVELMADVTVTKPVVIGKDLTIDGAGHTFTGKINATTKGTYVTINNLKFDGNNKAYTYAIEAELTNGLTINNCEAKDYKTGFIFHKDGDKVTVNGATVKNAAAAFNISRSNDCKLENVTLESVTYGLHVQNYGARTYTIKNWTAIDTDYITYVQNKSTAIVTFQLEGINEFNGGQLHNSQYAKYNHNYSVAMIGETGYPTLADAIKAATAGQTITFIADINENVTISKSLTIDGAGNQYTGKMTANTSVTVQNVAFVNAGITRTDGKTGTYTIKGCTFDGNGTYFYPLYFPGSGGKLIVEDCSVTNYAYSFLYAPKNLTVSVKNVTVENLPNYAVMFNSSFTATFENFTVKNTPVGIYVNNTAGRALTLNNCTMEDVETAIQHRNGTNTITVNAQNADDINFGTAAVSQYVKFVYKNENNENKAYAAIAGGNLYTTFAEALAAANEGDRVIMLADVTASDIITIDKAITLDGNGKTLTSTAARAINIETKGKVVINNLTVNAAERAFNIINQAATVELNDVTATASNNAVMIATSAGAANVTINGCDFTGLAVVNVAGAGAQVAINDTKITNIDANEAENYGAISVFKTATNAAVVVNGGKVVVADDSVASSVGAEGATVTFNGTEGADKVQTVVAYIGDGGYTTLKEAIEDAKTGDVVSLISDIDASEIITIDKAIILDGNGKKLTSTAGRAINVDGANGAKIQNLTIVASGERAINVINGATNVTIDNVTATAANYAVNLAGSAANAVVTVKNSNLTGLNVVNVAAAGAQVTVTGGTLTCNDQTDVENYSALALNQNAEGATITATGVDFDIKGNSTIYVNGALNGKITIDGEEYQSNVVAIIEYEGTDNYYSFTTLAGAVAKAEEGETVKIMQDATGAGVVIDKSITIDFNGKTYSFNEGVGSTGTKTNGFQILKGNKVTLKNGALNVDEKAKEKFYILVQNYADHLTVEDMYLDGTYLDKYSMTDGDSYTLSNNNGNVDIKGKTVITQNNDGALAYALDACDKSAAGYALPEVTVNEGVDINGNVEVSATLNFAGTLSGAIVINAGTVYGAEGLNVTAGKADHKVVYENGAYTIAAMHYVAQVGEQKFETLAAAVAAAKAGDTVTLLADIDESVTLSKNVTIDGANFKYTGVMTGNAALTITVQYVNFVNGGFEKTTKSSTGEYTFQNCTFDGADNKYPYALRIRGAKTVNVENCTAVDYMYGLLYAYSSTTNLNVKNVTVENCPDYAIYLSSGVTNNTIEGLTVKNAEDGIVVNNTASRKLTIKDCAMENVGTAIKHSKGTFTITVKAQGANNFGGAAISEYVKFEGAVAQVGSSVYGDLNDAFAAAKTGETVTLLEDVELTDDDVITIGGMNTFCHVAADKNITFDMNEKSITVAYNGDNYLFGVFFVDGGLTVTGNGTITIPQEDRQVAYMFLKRYAIGHLTIENGTFHAGNLEDSMIYTNATNVVTVKGGTFTIGHIGERENGCPWIFNTNGKNEKYVNVCGGTYNWDISRQHWINEVKLADGLATTKIDDNLWTVGTAVAAIDGHGYVTLADAVEAAEADETVTLLTDVTGAGLVINKDVTIDFNEKTYSFNEGVGSTGTASNGFQILKGNDVTLQNGTLNVAEEAKDYFYILVQNYANLTVENMTLDGTNLDKWSKHEDQVANGDSYVLSNNSGEVLITGNTNIIANDEGSKAFAFDACTKDGYKAPVVNVNTTGKITGKIENSATIAISSGIFTTPIADDWCAEYYVPVQNADGTYGVEKRYIDEVTIEDDGKVTKFVNEKEMTVGTLTYKRNFSKSGVGDWQGFYVPFEVPVSDLADLGYEVAYILDVHYEYDYDKFDIKGAPNTHIIKLNSGILRANHPYVIRPTKNADPNLNLVLQYTDATLFSTEENVIAVESSSTTHRFVFSGTYKTAKKAELNGSNDIPCYLINNDGEFQLIGTNVNIATFRVYLSVYKKDGSPVILDETAGSIKMRVIGEEDENGETVIYDVEMDGEQTSDYIYDLHGRRVMEPQKGGIYIVNGKKVVF